MKKNIIKYGVYVGVAVVTFLVVFLCMYLIEKNKTNKMIKDFNKAFESEEKQIIFYASSTCHYCELEKPILKQIAKDYDLKYVEIDASKLSKKQREDMLSKLNITGATPTTVVVQKGKPIYTQVGYLDGQDYVDFFVEAGFIKEGSRYTPEENLTFIGYEDLKMLENGYVVFGYTANYDCLELKKTMNKIAKDKKVDVYYYNFGNLNEEEYYASFEYLDEINTKDLKIYDDNKFIYPTIGIIKNGKLDKITTETEENKIIKELGL